MSAIPVAPHYFRQRLWVQVGAAALTPTLTLPADPRALVLVVNASGDRTYERVNRAAATALWGADLATLEADLLTREEAVEDADTPAFRFDLDFIAGRIAAVLTAAAGVPALRALETGVFAAGPCAAGALVAAAERPDLIQSLACRSARLELVGSALVYVRAPVLLLLGERDVAHRDAHYAAMTLLPPRSHLEIVKDARHLLDRPADVRRVGQQAADWFRDTLGPRWAIAGRGVGPVELAGV